MVQVLNRGSTRVRRRSEARRMDILRAAARVFRRHGVAAAGMREIAEEADVLVYDAWATGEPEGAQRLIEGLRDLHPDIPVVLLASGIEPEEVLP